MKDSYHIKNVAIYLRKSRPKGQDFNEYYNKKKDNREEYDDLKEHREDLISLCKDNGWAYTEYPEIGSGDKIDARPRMVELLQDVELGMYDAVVAVHIDRLSRGDEGDQARVKKTFARSETLLVTLTKTYDFNNESDILTADFEGLIARMELKSIARRFRQGKARRAKQGFWSNGKPPFPYTYDRQSGKAVPDHDKLLVYRRMIDLCLSGYATTDIAWELNKEGVPSPRGGLWSPQVVRRLLTDEVHLGKIVVGKKRKLVGADAIVSKPKDEWIVYNNCHEAVKTEREHTMIQFLIQRQKETPTASRAGSHAFSGLIRCSKCGYTMQIQKRSDRPSDYLKSCTHRDPFGVRCTNLGGVLQEVADAVHVAIQAKKAELERAIRDGIQLQDLKVLYELAEQKQAELKKYDRMLNKLEDTYFAEEISKDRYMLKKAEYETRIAEIEDEYRIILEQVDNTENTKNEDMLDSVKRVITVLEDPKIEAKERNRAYKSIIHSVEWERNGLDDVGTVKVNFL